MTKSKNHSPYSAEFRERAIRMVREHRGEHASQWSAVASIAAKIGCTAQTLQNWMNVSANFPAPFGIEFCDA